MFSRGYSALYGDLASIEWTRGNHDADADDERITRFAELFTREQEARNRNKSRWIGK